MSGRQGGGNKGRPKGGGGRGGGQFGQSSGPRQPATPAQQTTRFSQSGGGRDQARGGPSQGSTGSSYRPPQGYGGFSGSRGTQGVGQLEEEIRALAITNPITSLSKNAWFGTKGQIIKVIVNFFNMKYEKGVKLHHYDVHLFSVKQDEKGNEIKTRSVKRQLFWKIVRANAEFFGDHTKIIYDDGCNMYTLEKLNVDGKDMHIDEEITENERTQTIRMEIKPTAIVSIDNNTLNLLITQLARCPIDALNGIVHCDIDRMYLLPQAERYIPLDLDNTFLMLRGLCAYAKRGPKDGAAFANYDIIHSAFYKMHVDVLQFYSIAKRGKTLSERDLKQLESYSLNSGQRKELRSLLSGVRFRSKIGLLNRYYRFTNVVDSTAKTKKIDYQPRNPQGEPDGPSEKVTVEEYYAKRYQYTLKYPHMPLIQCGPKEKDLCFPIEALMISEHWQKLKRLLPEYMQAASTPWCTREPALRFTDITKMMEDCRVQEDPFLQNFQVEVDPKFLQIEGRVIPPPTLNPKATGVVGMNSVFSVVIVDDCINWQRNGARLFKNFIEGCKFHGMTGIIGDNALEVYNLDSHANNVRKLLEERQRIAEINAPKAQLMLFFIMPQRSDYYVILKTICDIELGVHSQFLQMGVFNRMATVPDKKYSAPMYNAVIKNVFMKVNAKLGGVNKKVANMPDWSKFTSPNDPTLFIGIDVTHPAPGDLESESISALVGSINIEATRYSASVRKQTHRTEWIEPIREMMVERLRAFCKGTKKPPQHIVVFRDGVSDSQFDGVKEYEHMKMLEACRFVGGPKYKPTFTIVVVQKRHHTRFYARDVQHKEANKKNVPPGTVVDKQITGFIPKYPKEFYLCSHYGMLGTSRPAHYYVLHDDFNLTADEIQSCAFNLCNLFARAPTGVSLPAPVYYAHLCCFRARHHVAGGQAMDPSVQVHAPLNDHMYFC